jgi:hypothetical protein
MESYRTTVLLQEDARRRRIALDAMAARGIELEALARARADSRGRRYPGRTVRQWLGERLVRMGSRLGAPARVGEVG